MSLTIEEQRLILHPHDRKWRVIYILFRVGLIEYDEVRKIKKDLISAWHRDQDIAMQQANRANSGKADSE